MPIYAPGKRDRRNRKGHAGSNLMASLSLTPMVDMFTILVVFLLQSYNTTGEVLHIPKEVQLPKATQIKELKPAHVVIVTATDLILDTETVGKMQAVKDQKDWLITNLRDRLVEVLRQDKIKVKQAIVSKIKTSLPNPIRPAGTPVPEESLNKITVQADKNIDFLTLKKIMFTVTEAGASEINFAVLKKDVGPVVSASPTSTGG